MKIFLKHLNLYWTGKVSYKKGICEYVMTKSIGQAREFGSIETAIEYAKGWEKAVDWEIETVKEKKKQEIRFFHNNERIIPKSAKDAIERETTLENIRNVYKPGECDHCKGTGIIMNAVCPYCNCGYKHGYGPNFPKGGVDYTATYLNPNYTIDDPPENREFRSRQFEEKCKSMHQKACEILSTPLTSTRSISDLLKEADANQLNYSKLSILHEELTRNKTQYSKAEILFADEHIMDYVEKIKESHEKENLKRRFESD